MTMITFGDGDDDSDNNNDGDGDKDNKNHNDDDDGDCDENDYNQVDDYNGDILRPVRLVNSNRISAGDQLDRGS